MEKKMKRLLSLAIALVMVVSLLPGKTLVAEAADAACPCGCGQEAANVQWKDLNTSLTGDLTEAGHYYLSADLQLGTVQTMEICADVVLDLRGKDIRPAEGYRTIFVNKAAKLTVLDTVGGGEIYGADITAGTGYGGAVYVDSTAVFTMLSGVIRDGKATRGGNLLSLGTTTISGKARITGGNADRGGNIYVTGGSTTVNGYAKVLDGVATTTGGNIMVQNTGATLTLAGRTTVAGGQARNGINLASMYSNVVITNNAVVDAGATEGATSMNIAGSGEQSSTLDISGGTLYGKIDVGALVSSIKISGAPVIKHLSLATGKRIDPTGMTAGASVTVEAVDAAITGTLTNAASYAPYFHGYAANTSVIAKDNVLQIAAEQYCRCGCGKAVSAISWTSWAGGAISESGHYRLSAAKTLSGTLEIAAGLNVVVDLNGKTLTASGARAFDVFGTLTVLDSVGSGKIVGADVSGLSDASPYPARGGAIRVDAEGVFNLCSGTITGGKATRGGNIQSYGKINIYGGTITSGYSGRGNNINNEGDLYIYGGTISVDASNYNANTANIYSTSQSNTVYLSGGTITGPTGVESVSLFYSNLYVSGGTISGGQIKVGGYKSVHSRIVVNGGTINADIQAENTTDPTMQAELVINGGTLNGAVKVPYAKSFRMSGAPKISKLTLGSGVKISINDLSTAASVTFTSAPTVFTAPMSNPAQYTGVFKQSGKTCIAGGGVLAMAGSTTTGTSGSSNNIAWTLLSTGELLLSGTGAMSDYNTTNLAPWSGSVNEVYIGEGITQIGHWAFYNNGTINGIYIPTSLNNIRSYVFRQSTISKVEYAGTRSQWNTITIGSTNTELLKVVDTANFHCTGVSDGATVVPENRPVNTTSWSVSGNTLTISGKGQMPGYYYDTAMTRHNNAPWSAYADQITNVVISSGVTSIGNWAFYGLKNVTTVTIPSTVTTIGENAFRDCSALQSVNISNVKTIGSGAFMGCTALTTVTAGSSLTVIGNYAFLDCAALSTLTGPTAVTTLGNAAFDGCTSLTAFGDWFGDGAVSVNGIEYTGVICENGVWYNADKTVLLRVPGGYSGSFTVPEGVTEIADYALAGCAKITAITVADSVTILGGAAFDGCTAAQTLHIGAGVTTYKVNTFANCDSLQAFTVSQDNSSMSADATGALCSKGKTKLRRAPGGVENYTVSSSVDEINQYAFACNNTVKEVTLSAKTASAGKYAFAATPNLQTVNITTALTNISVSAFESSNIQAVNYSGTPTQWAAITIGAYNEPLLAATVHSILLEKVSCGTKATCTLTSDGELTISGTGSITSAPWSAHNAQIKTVVISDGITDIPASAFADCENLTTVTIPVTVKTIGDNAFSGCTGLTQATYAGSEGQWNKLSVGAGNDQLQAVVGGFAAPIPEKLEITTLPTKQEYVAGETLDPTGMVVTLTYDNGTTAVVPAADYILSGEILAGKSTLTVTYGELTATFQVSATASGVSGAVNWTIDTNGKLTISGSGKMDYNNVAWSAHMANITAVEIQTGVIGDLSKGAFRNAVNLQSVSLPEGIEWISANAFSGCTSLTEIVLPGTTTDIRDSAFSKCTNLKQITIGEGIKIISANAFNNCTALTDIYFGGDKIQWNAYGVTLAGTVTIHCAKRNVVSVAADWTEQPKLIYDMNEEIDLTGLVVTVSYDDGTSETTTDYVVEYDFTTAGDKRVQILFNGKFVDEYSVTVFPWGVTEEGLNWHVNTLIGLMTITGEGAMANYTAEAPAPWAEYAETIKEVQIGSGSTAIGDNAFAGCTKLTVVTLPKTVTTIGVNAFGECVALETVNYGGLETEWSGIVIGENNDTLLNANRVSMVLYGDVDGNGVVNTCDALRLMKYLASYDVEVDLKAADATGDGKINTMDALRIMKYLAEWDVTLGPQ